MHAISFRSRVFRERRIFINENGKVAAQRSFYDSRREIPFEGFMTLLRTVIFDLYTQQIDDDF